MAESYALDADGDGFTPPLDCDDTDPAINPLHLELCNDIDDNCNGVVDESYPKVWWPDRDADGLGAVGDPVWFGCEARQDYQTAGNTGDCDDSNASIPGAGEFCNGVDDDCDGVIDDDPRDAVVWYEDADDDGFGVGDAQEGCPPPDRPVAGLSGYCRDDDAAIHPAAAETCNGVDDDCDGFVDEEGCAPPTSTTTPPVAEAPVRAEPDGCGCATGAPWTAFAVLPALLGARRRRATGSPSR